MGDEQGCGTCDACMAKDRMESATLILEMVESICEEFDETLPPGARKYYVELIEKLSSDIDECVQTLVEIFGPELISGSLGTAVTLDDGADDEDVKKQLLH